jgi:hypothetical protein
MRHHSLPQERIGRVWVHSLVQETRPRAPQHWNSVIAFAAWVDGMVLYACFCHFLE